MLETRDVEGDGDVRELVERRSRPRQQARSWVARIESRAGVFTCSIVNFSLGGAMLQSAAPLAPKDAVRLVLKDLGSLEAEIVWRLPEKDKMGIRFTDAPEEIARIFNGAIPL